MRDLSTELGFALDVARLGGRIALGHFRKDPEARRKADGTWVTEADWAVEAQIRLRIARTFPEHNVLGEEEGLSAAGGGEPIDGAPTWIIDPIDATHNYMAGVPIWATLVALREGGESLVGVCHAPAIDETYEATVGGGARMNGASITVSEPIRMDQATVFTTGLESFLQEGLDELYLALVKGAWRTRGFGDFWGHMLVARGAGHVMIEPELNLWDVAALEPIVREAGGRITGLDGRPWSSGPCLTACPNLHNEVLKLAAAHGRG